MSTYSLLTTLSLTLVTSHRQYWDSSDSDNRWSRGWSKSSSEERPTAPGCATEIGRCGLSWKAANQCGTCCNDNTDCTEPNEECYGGLLNRRPCVPLDCSKSKGRCGMTWDNAASKCGQCCDDDSWCTDIPGEKCFKDLENEWTANVCDSKRPKSADRRGIKAISGCGTGKKVSLTFDDGPAIYNGETQAIINSIAALNAQRPLDQQIVATFYVSPNSHGHADTEPTCELIQTITDAGHEVQSHSFNHGNYAQMTKGQIERDLDKNKKFITQCGGSAPTIFRPPYGDLDAKTARFINKQGYILGYWTLDTKDYECLTCAEILDNINSKLSNFGEDSVNILMHDRYVYQCIPEIIAAFDGYEFITQSECYNECDTMDNAICSDQNGNNYWLIDAWCV